MSSDKFNEIDEEAWVSAQRQRVVHYLESQKVRHAGVGEWPAFHVVPYFALWAVQSPTNAGMIGWWAVSGDLPTDYMSSSDGYHPRDAMKHFSRIWAESANYMKQDKYHPDLILGNKTNRVELAPLLLSRSEILKKWSEDNMLWKESADS